MENKTAKRKDNQTETRESIRVYRSHVGCYLYHLDVF